MKLVWNVYDADGMLLFTTIRYDDTAINRQRVGQTLRRAFSKADGFSVTRCKVRD
jgi:hypothetical protein